jgi:hypothetical protein
MKNAYVLKAARALVALLLVYVFGFALSVQAGDKPEYTLVIKDHRFHPEVLEIPADTKVVLIVDNQDPTPEEFESHDFDREKVIPGNTQAKIYVGPLDAGEYSFFGEFNEDTCQGKLVVKPAAINEQSEE